MGVMNVKIGVFILHENGNKVILFKRSVFVFIGVVILAIQCKV